MLNLENVECLGHSTIKIKDKNNVIYFDPYKINKEYKDANIIFITHSHYAHFSEEDILKLKKDDTIIVITEDLYDKTKKLDFLEDKIIKVKPNNEYKVNDIKFNTIEAYNIDKNFHKKEEGWVGYILNIDNIKYYIAGDTDITEENKLLKCDIAFVPVGGKYTMNFMEAASLINIIKPSVAVPIHYGVIVGTKDDAESFKENIDKDIKCIIMY